MGQTTAFGLIIVVALALFADARWYDWEYSLWVARYFDSWIEWLKFWR